jgi:putative redox protein
MSEPRTATVKLADGTSFLATSGSGHTITIDNSPDHGGHNLGPTPMELLLLGLAGCTGMDVIAMLRKARQDVTDYEVRAEGERAEAHPRVYSHIVVTHIVRGRNLNPRIIAHAVELSATRYCPASATLGAVGRIEEVVRVVDEATGTETEERIQHADEQPTHLPKPSSA